MPPFPVRLAYVVEFLLALLAILMLWGQAGGQEHLELMPWYAKLILPVGLAWVIVAGTASAAGRQKVWNRATILCAAMGLLIVISMGLLSYYFHIHEGDDDDDAHAGDAVTAVLRPDLRA